MQCGGVGGCSSTRSHLHNAAGHQEHLAAVRWLLVARCSALPSAVRLAAMASAEPVGEATLSKACRSGKGVPHLLCL